MVNCVNCMAVDFVVLAVLCLAMAHKLPEIVLYEGDACVTSSYDGKCLVEKQCPNLEATMTRKGLYAKDVGHCGYTVYEEIICCPENITERPLSKKYFKTTEVHTTVTLIFTTTAIVQTEIIEDELVFSNYTTSLDTK
ncbi:uncharacterized protein LOC129237902 [Anastrepha obliqua]|uniref:uncharacterized protein LOC129237902 n=1 Tax=Anastrepha obliqua TaxID=95512 RepID=UPI0024094166|nr:uncharacterized protein LOC129237902 [Anastrepha obliqua]